VNDETNEDSVKQSYKESYHESLSHKTQKATFRAKQLAKSVFFCFCFMCFHVFCTMFLFVCWFWDEQQNPAKPFQNNVSVHVFSCFLRHVFVFFCWFSDEQQNPAKPSQNNEARHTLLDDWFYCAVVNLA